MHWEDANICSNRLQFFINNNFFDNVQCFMLLNGSLFSFPQISVDRLYNRKEVVEALEKYIEQPHFKEVYVDLVSYQCYYGQTLFLRIYI